MPAPPPRRWGVLLAAAVAVPLTAGWHFGNVWKAMPTAYVVLGPLALWTLRPRLAGGAGALARGLAAAALLYIAGALFVGVASATSPALSAEIDALYRLVAAAPDSAVALGVLVLVITGEELVWRHALLLPMARRLGPVTACLASSSLYALAHATAAPPLLALLALAAGTFWSLLALRSQGLVAPLASHLLWDLAVLYGAPYRDLAP